MSYDLEFQKHIFEMFEESQYWPQEQMQAFQESQLKQLLKFARDKVPFYKDRLAHALTSRGEIDWDNWYSIPILKRSDLIDHRDAMLAAELPPGHGYVDDHLGSGTTGKPVSSRHNSLVPLISRAGHFRAFKWYGVDYSKTFCSFVWKDLETAKWPEGKEHERWGPHWLPNNAAGRSLTISLHTSPENVAEFYHRNCVSYVSGWSQWVHAAALASEKMGLNTKIDAVFAFGTATTDQERDDCKRIFGADIFSLYASKEVYDIGHQCATGNHFHTTPELNFLEVLDENGNPCKIGHQGRAVITNLYNTSQPFIRYEQGDQIIMGHKCLCGRSLPVIERVAGRIGNLFRFPNGRKIAMFLPPRFMDMIGASGWQIAQTEPLKLEVRYVFGYPKDPVDFQVFTRFLKEQTDPDVVVEYKRLSELPNSRSGKFIQFVCELPPDARSTASPMAP